MLSLPPSLAPETLSETVPTAFAPADFSAEDYAVEWEGSAPQGVRATLEPGSLMWVRVADVLVLPRARLVVSMEDAVAGTVSSAGFSQPMSSDGANRGSVRVPIALLSGEGNSIEVAVKRPGGAIDHGKLLVRFRRASDRQLVFFDSSCSRFGLSAESAGKPAGWAYVGCRLAETDGGEHRTSSLELYVYWDGIGDKLDIGGISTPSTSVGVWPIRLRANPGSLRLAAGDAETTLRYHVAENLHRGHIGFGLGPYMFTFQGLADNVSSGALLATVYGSYFVTEAMRVVAFDATSLNGQLYTDFGVYLSSEYVRTLDKRIAVNLLLGGHVVGFSTGGQYYFRLGAPQGVEVVFTDFLKTGCNGSLGAFIYPEIDDKAYYNVWLRWGTSRFFGELNYISFRESVDDQPIYSRSVGISFGIPLPSLGFF